MVSNLLNTYVRLQNDENVPNYIEAWCMRHRKRVELGDWCSRRLRGRLWLPVPSRNQIWPGIWIWFRSIAMDHKININQLNDNKDLHQLILGMSWGDSDDSLKFSEFCDQYFLRLTGLRQTDRQTDRQNNQAKAKYNLRLFVVGNKQNKG